MVTTLNKKRRHDLAAWTASDGSNIALNGNLTEEEEEEQEEQEEQEGPERKLYKRITIMKRQKAAT